MMMLLMLCCCHLARLPQVYQALCPEVGGSLTITLDEMIAKLARSKVGWPAACCMLVGLLLLVGLLHGGPVPVLPK